MGANIARIRDAVGITQKELADRTHLSQSTISKLENSPDDDGSLADLGRIATALEVPLTELLENTRLATFLGGSDETFRAYCPNPFCRSNRVKMQGGEPFVTYGSWKEYETSEFNEINFCEFCGEKLIKNCPSCQAFIRTASGAFCSRCGAQVNDRPTKDEWKQITDMLSKENIPF